MNYFKRDGTAGEARDALRLGRPGNKPGLAKKRPPKTGKTKEIAVGERREGRRRPPHGTGRDGEARDAVRPGRLEKKPNPDLRNKRGRRQKRPSGRGERAGGGRRKARYATGPEETERDGRGSPGRGAPRPPRKKGRKKSIRGSAEAAARVGTGRDGSATERDGRGGPEDGARRPPGNKKPGLAKNGQKTTRVINVGNTWEISTDRKEKKKTRKKVQSENPSVKLVGGTDRGEKCPRARQKETPENRKVEKPLADGIF